uniref:Uncharacterized protein n=1 Tax=Oryza brachyantha TaxID=4533 RepID=J3LV54_ORYBR
MAAAGGGGVHAAASVGKQAASRYPFQLELLLYLELIWSTTLDDLHWFDICYLTYSI